MSTDDNTSKKLARIQSLIKRLDQCIESKDFYFAQQLYKTISARYKSLGKINESNEILMRGAITLLSNNEVNAGADLALLLIDTYKSSNVKPTEENMSSILKIFNSFQVETHPKKTLFIKRVIEWSSSEKNNHQGEPYLHNFFAKYFEDIKQYGSSQAHYIRGSQPKQFAHMVSKWADEGYPNELDLFLTRAILMYLCLNKVDDANCFYNTFLSLRTKQEMDTPLVNYCRFLLKSVKHKAVPLFKELNQKYKISLDRDSSFQEYIEKISRDIFGLEVPRGNIFTNLLRGLMQS